MKPSEYISYDAMGLAELVRAKEVTPDELLDTALDIAEKVQPQIGALCNVREDVARKRIEEGLPDGIFTGVPFILKDIKAQCSDIPMSLGSRFFKNMTTPFDNALVSRYRKAGLNIFGRGTTAELALWISTEAKNCYGYDTANPWDTRMSPGGSSGGSAAAVAAGILPMAHATDGAGSIRLPAANCGLVGLKPTRALLPAGPVIGEMWAGLLSDGVVSRTVRDTAASLDATKGPDLGCPYYAPSYNISYLEAIKEPPRKLKIAFTKNLWSVEASPAVQKAIEDTAKLCADLGHEVVEDCPKFDVTAMWDAYFVIYVASTAMNLEDRIKAVGRMPGSYDVEAPTHELMEMKQHLSASDYVRAVTTIHRIARQIAAFYEDYDVLLSPISAEPSYKMGYFVENPVTFTREIYENKDYSSYFLYEPVANLTGQPAISLPLFWSEDGLPIGSHFFGRVGEDATLLQLSAQLEEAQPWFDKICGMAQAL